MLKSHPLQQATISLLTVNQISLLGAEKMNATSSSIFLVHHTFWSNENISASRLLAVGLYCTGALLGFSTHSDNKVIPQCEVPVHILYLLSLLTLLAHSLFHFLSMMCMPSGFPTRHSKAANPARGYGPYAGC